MAGPAAIDMPRANDVRTAPALGIAVAAVAVYVIAGMTRAHTFELIAKPIPALMLAAWVWPRTRSPYATAIAAGLIFSAVADYVIELRTGFLDGVALFLAAHIAYVIAFLTASRALRPAILGAFVLWGVGMFSLVRAKLGDMTVPVVVYSTVLCSMMWRACALLGGSGLERSSANAAAAGALLFGISDTLIAVNRWYAPVPHASFWIMSLYWLGQLGIARSARGQA